MRPLYWAGRAVGSAVDWSRAGLDMAAAGWSKVRRVVGPENTDSDCSPVPVVILPGVLEPWRYLLPLGRFLADEGHPVHYVRGLGFNLKDLASSAKEVLSLFDELGLANAVLVAHSKGGLIGKSVLASPALEGRARGMVSLSTPYAGSGLGGPLQRLPLVSRTPFGMFISGNPVLLSLAEERDVNEHIISLAPRWDQVTAPSSSHLPGARNLAVPASGHFRPIRSRSTWRIIHDCIHEISR